MDRTWRYPFPVVAALALTALSPAASQAQFWEKITNPGFEVPITHPPQVVMKGVTRITVREIGGECGPELTDKISELLMTSGRFEVLDRANVDALFQEHGLQLSGAVGPSTVGKMGQILGASAMVMGRVTRCNTKVSEPLVRKKAFSSKIVSVVKTTATMTASLQLADLTTGKIYSARSFDGTAVQERESDIGIPEAPDTDAALTEAYGNVVREFLKVIVPWQETVKLTVYDDSKMSLKLSSNQMKTGQFAEAAATLKAALDGPEAASADPKLMAKVNYNLGIALMYSDNPAEALPFLQRAQGMKGGGIVNDAIATCSRMIQQQRLAEVKEANAIEVGAAPAGSREARASSREILGNQEVIDMARARMSDSVIISKIRSSPCNFDTTTRGLVSLKSAGVSDVVLQVIAEVRR